jgi:hypothetical protein
MMKINEEYELEYDDDDTYLMESEVLLLNYLLLLALSSTRDKKECLEFWDKYKASFTFPLI